MNVKMKAPEGACSVNVEGTEYEVKDGFVEVEVAHHQVLLAHGYEIVVAEEKPAKPAKAAKAGKGAPAAEQSTE